MKVLIIGTRRARKTGRKLASALGAEYCENLLSRKEFKHVVFRYGNSTSLLPLSFGMLINRAIAINRATNKLEMKQILERYELPTPRLLTSTDCEFPVVARSVAHYQGRGFAIVRNKEEAKRALANGMFLQEKIANKDEYRVFVMFGRVLEVNKKVPIGTPKSTTIRNYRNGWFFKWILVQNAPKELKNISVAAVSALGLDFGAVDCCFDIHENPWIFEVNTAPAMNDRKIAKVVRKIKEHYPEDWNQAGPASAPTLSE
ncbi:MAG: hypothetical protein JRI45_06690 [Deltaproteobacteria bacterium]|nr:hypothetical protein [Deltaproteobacteria bacterium]